MMSKVRTRTAPSSASSSGRRHRPLSSSLLLRSIAAVALLAAALGFVGRPFLQGPQHTGSGLASADEARSSRREALQSTLWGLAGGAFGLEAMNNGRLAQPARADGDSDRIVLPPIDRMDKFRCRWQSSSMGQANAARAKLFDLRECDMSGTSAATYDIAGAIMSDGDFSKVDFTRTTMSKAVARNAKFVNATFKNAVIDRVAFQGSNLKNAIFQNAIMTGTTFPDSNLENVDFTDASLNEWGMAKLCGNPTMKGKNPVTGADTFLSAGCDMIMAGMQK